MTVPTLYLLVGVPGSGKTTWIDSQEWAKHCVVVSTDRHVEEHARNVGKTYSEVFEEYMPTAVRLMTEDVVGARELGRNIVWDQTSTTVASRRKKLVMLPTYRKVAIVFTTPPHDELLRRVKSRPGKVIPQRVLLQMIDGWEDPTLEEGFDEIWHAT